MAEPLTLVAGAVTRKSHSCNTDLNLTESSVCNSTKRQAAIRSAL